jgi:2-hydroxy-6-oxonona-2,4-dienedioate hydrolase
MENNKSTLDPNDPKVIQAKNAEQALFEFYRLQAKDHYIYLPKQAIKVRVSEIGSGKPIVIVPGNTGDVFPLSSLLAQLKGRRIIAINRPGGGLSEGMNYNLVDIRQFAIDTLDTVFETFNLENADIVAHSIGAHWSTLFAMEKPNRVRRLVLLGNPGNIMCGKPPLIIRLIGKPFFSKLIIKLITQKDKSKALIALTKIGHSRSLLAKLPHQLGDAYYYFSLLPHYILSATSMLQNAMPSIDAMQLKKLSQPTALLLGTNDNFISQDLGKKIISEMPNGTFYSIKGSGHLPWLENPEECGQLISNFIDK